MQNEDYNKNENHKKYTKIMSTVNVVLSVAAIVLLLLKTCCGC